MTSTATIISNLQAENESLRQQLADITLERDVQKADIAFLNQQLAEKDAEIDLLKGSLENQVCEANDFAYRLENKTAQLSASQAREQRLREALRKIADLRNLGKIEPEVVAFEALTLQQDTTALEAIITKAGEVMRERCESTLETIGAEDNCYGGAHAIRALSSVTLEDIK